MFRSHHYNAIPEESIIQCVGNVKVRSKAEAYRRCDEMCLNVRVGVYWKEKRTFSTVHPCSAIRNNYFWEICYPLLTHSLLNQHLKTLSLVLLFFFFLRFFHVEK